MLVNFPCLGFSPAKKDLQKIGCFLSYKLRKTLDMRNFAIYVKRLIFYNNGKKRYDIRLSSRVLRDIEP